MKGNVSPGISRVASTVPWVGQLPVRVAWRSGQFLWLDAPDGWDPVYGAVEGRDGFDTRALRVRDKVSLCKIEPVHLVDFDGPEKNCFIDHCDGLKGDDRSNALGHLRSADLIEGLENVDHLRHDEIDE